MEKKDKDEAARSPPPTNGKFPLIKIKISKKTAEEEEEAAEVVVKSHQCKECNKSFSSGKALGGHMSSAHVQANKDYSGKKASSSGKRKSSSAASCSGSGSGSSSTTCGLCSKNFHSNKSLYGHMRKHPERSYRGMVPRPESRIDSSSSDDDEAGRPELGFSLTSWPTCKRGRGPIFSDNSDSEKREKDKEKEKEPIVAGLQLLKMLESRKKEEENPRIPTAIAIDKESEKMDEIDPADELVFTAIEVLANGKRGAMEAESSSSPPKETTPSSEEKFRCHVCSKVFLTHQALGGHRASHNKFKINVINTNARPAIPETPPKKKKPQKKKEEDKQLAASTAEVEEAEAEAAFAFDLNVAPAEEE